jgi:Flp pilus assembly pilin Flp
MREILANAVAVRLRCDDALKRIRRFVHSEKGVVTVEWVALAACMALGAIVLSYAVLHSLGATANSIGCQLTTCTTP